jgi:LemA protein
MFNLFAVSVGGIIAILAVVTIALGILAWAIGKRNSFVQMVNTVEEGFATIDVYLKKRYDMIPNLVETVKGYAKHEKSTLEDVIKARSFAMGAGPEDKAQAENMLSGTLKSLFAVVEKYPELKADKQFLELQEQLQAIETDIAQSRKYYNAVVKKYNTQIQIFPDNIIANSMKLQKKPYFEVDNDEERKNVKVQF